MDNPDITLRVRDAAGGVVLDLCSGGYYATAAPAHEETWRRDRVTSPWVDGDGASGTPDTLDSQRIPLTVRIEGATWVEVEQRRLALKSATTQPLWFLEVASEGVSFTYRAGRADSTSPFTTADVADRRRVVSMTVPVQPTPAVTGV